MCFVHRLQTFSKEAHVTKFIWLTILLSFILLTVTANAEDQTNSARRSLLAFLFKPSPTKSNQQPEPSSTSSTSKLEQEALEIINQERIKYNAPPVVPNEKLNNLARNYAARLIRENFFAHVDPQGKNPEQRASEAGIIPGVYENLAMQPRGYGQSDTQLIVNANAAMMNEPPDEPNHRYNILVPKHVCVGIGVALSGNKLFLVEEFTDAIP
jgi:uncharacterized protein YkwD